MAELTREELGRIACTLDQSFLESLRQLDESLDEFSRRCHDFSTHMGAQFGQASTRLGRLDSRMARLSFRSPSSALVTLGRRPVVYEERRQDGSIYPFLIE